MATIQSLGIGSGLLTADLADQIIAAEREASDLRLERKTAKVDAQITAYGEIQSALSSLQASAQSLSSATNIRQTKASSSDSSAVTATTSSTADVGNYSLVVNSVAQSHTVASQSYNSVTDTLGLGTLTFRFGEYSYDDITDEVTGFTQNSAGKEFSINLTSANNTLGGVRDAINAADIGVQASLVNDGSGYRLLLSSKEAGLDNSMEITATGDAAIQGLAYNATQNDENANMVMTQKAQSASLTVNGLAVTSRTNQLTEIIRGVTVNLNSATEGKTVNLSISRDTSGVVEKTEAFVEAYNFYREVYSEVTKFTPGENAGGLLLGDSTLRTVQNQVRSALTQIVSGLESAEYRSLADIGIFTDSTDNYKLSLNASTLEAAFQSSIESVTGLFANTNSASDSLINYVAKTADTKPGSYPIEITQLATQAKYTGKSIAEPTAMSPVVIGGSNDSLRMNVDGTTATIALTQGSYESYDDLALMVQNAINNNETMQGRGRSVSVAYDQTTGEIEITSSRFGSSSQISIVDADPMVANTLGITLAGQGGVSGQFYNSLNDQAFAASTIPGSREVFATDAFDFAVNTVSFDLNVDLGDGGGVQTYNITLDEDMSDVLDIEGNIVNDRTRSDMLAYINQQLAATGVTASFNSANRIVFSTGVTGDAKTLELANVNVTGQNDVLGLADAEGLASSGVTIAADTEFVIDISNRYTTGIDGFGEEFDTISSNTLTIPPGTYQTPEDLAQQIQDLINADANIVAEANGALTSPASRPIGTAIDFTGRPASFIFELNGTQVEVDINANGADNLDSIQTALDDALVASGFAAGDVIAKNDSGGLALETLATGSNQVLNILSDGQGARTATGIDLSVGALDLSTDPMDPANTYTLRVSDTNIEFTLNEDLTAMSLEERLAYIQAQLDEGLVAAGGGGEFIPGDVVARVNDANELFFETQSKNGIANTATFGALASIQMVSAPVADPLGIPAGAVQTNGRDTFGFQLGTYRGFDAQASVTYEKDEQGRGRFNIRFDNETAVSFSATSVSATSQLGFSLSDGTENTVATGRDVEGTINGIEARGNGQLLIAGNGDSAATNGYILGSPGFDFSSSVVLDSTSNSFRVTIDGIASGEISLSETSYATGRALADEMRRAINEDATLAAAGKTVDVQFDDATSTFGIFSASTGVQSRVRLTSIEAPLSAIMGLSPSSEIVDGKAATGTRDPAAGLQVRVLGGQTGSRGTVQYISGVFEQLGNLFKGILSQGGTVEARLSGLEKERELIDEEKARLETRIAATEQRLKSQFLFNDRIISRLNSTESFLQQQFEIMNGMLSGKK
ncbi:flagellar filament capping protein FliD [Salinispirillum marinum]|uniref:Filament cap protein n=2 Tax=Saccharospirillaceae TaxID=255527 RepID=A0ABV8BHP7_9GAMM